MNCFRKKKSKKFHKMNNNPPCNAKYGKQDESANCSDIAFENKNDICSICFPDNQK